MPDPYELLIAAGMERDLKAGFTLRADTWSGVLAAGDTKIIQHTLLKGNDYRFYASAGAPHSKISFHITDANGNVTELRSWQKERDGLAFAGASIIPAQTGACVLVLKVEQAPAGKTPWTLVYAYK